MNGHCYYPFVLLAEVSKAPALKLPLEHFSHVESKALSPRIYFEITVDTTSTPTGNTRWSNVKPGLFQVLVMKHVVVNVGDGLQLMLKLQKYRGALHHRCLYVLICSDDISDALDVASLS